MSRARKQSRSKPENGDGRTFHETLAALPNLITALGCRQAKSDQKYNNKEAGEEAERGLLLTIFSLSVLQRLASPLICTALAQKVGRGSEENSPETRKIYSELFPAAAQVFL